MFGPNQETPQASYRLAIVGLSLLSFLALVGSIWVMVDFVKEQALVEDLIGKLPLDARESAKELAGELRWQFRLSIIVVLNLVVTAIAIVLLWRAYQTSQESLRDFKVLATDILNSMEQVVMTTDEDGRVTSINRRGQEMFSVGTDCLGRPLSQVTSPLILDPIREEWRHHHRADSTADMKWEVEGNTRTLRASCRDLKNLDGRQNGNVIQLRDVTERVLMEERIRRMERYMGLGSLVAGLHHEIRNPLAALSLHVQLIEELLQDNEHPQEVDSMLSIIKSEVTRIGCVLENFRDFASVGKLNLSSVDLRDVVDSQLKLIGPQAEKQAVDLEFQQSGQPQNVQADRVRLEQVLLNLLVNALEAMPKGGHLMVDLAEDEDCRSVTIQDSGIGIPDDLHDRIFDPYFTTKGEGTGLGLALCDKIIRQHQGSLEFESRPGRTVFRIVLPLTNS